MKIKLLKNELTDHLQMPSFNCDNELGDIPKPLPCYNFNMAFIGKPKSGKTSLAISLLTNKKPKIYNKVFDHVILVAPPNSIASLKKNPFENLVHKYPELNYDTLETILDLCKDKYSIQDEQTLIFMDDVASSLKSTSIQSMFNEAVFNRRHYRMSIMLLSQNLVSIPLNVRKNLTHIVLFKPAMKE